MIGLVLKRIQQGYDAAMLMDAAVRDVKGKIEDKGRVVNKTSGKIFTDHPDAYDGTCKMK